MAQAIQKHLNFDTLYYIIFYSILKIFKSLVFLFLFVPVLYYPYIVMARAAQVITSSYNTITRPTNPFTQVNLTPNKTDGVTSYDNAEMVELLANVYTYAQQETSFLMPLFDTDTMTALFRKQDTFNKVNFIQKKEESPATPLFVPSGGTRAHSLLQFHQAFQISPTIDAVRRYPLMPKAQMEISKALGRLYDNAIIWCITSAVLKYTSTSSASFQGLAVPSTSEIPNSQFFFYASAASSGSITFKDPDAEMFDIVEELLENESIETSNVWYICSPRARRKFRNITEFRDRESTLAFEGREMSRYISWNDRKFVFMGPETLPDKTVFINKYSDGTAGKPVPSSTSGAYKIIAADASKYELMIAVDFSGIHWGTAPFATNSYSSLRDDYSYTLQWYVEVGFGGMRVDDDKVLMVAFSN